MNIGHSAHDAEVLPGYNNDAYAYKGDEEMKLSPIIRNGMVVQAGKPVFVHGSGAGYVTARFMGAERSLESHGGEWVIEFPPLSYGGPYEMELDLDGRREVITDIVVGEVILFAGQSNIQFRLEESNVPECGYADDGCARIYVCPRPEAGDRITPDNGWVKCGRENAGFWSALAYLTVREARCAGIPYVGAVVCCQGASVIESWIPESLTDVPELRLPKEKLFSDHADYPWNTPGFMYRYAMKAIMPYSFGNAVWYQGESNTSPDEAAIYPEFLRLLVENIRKDCRDGALPFRIVQIADTRDCPGWLGIQKAQSDFCTASERTYLVKSGDISEKDMIHPITKSPLAARIFLDMREKGDI